MALRWRRVPAGATGPVLEVQLDRGGHRAVVRLSGVLDRSSVGPVLDVVHRLVASGCRDVRLDADGLVLAGPDGRRALHALERAAAHEAGTVTWD